MQVAQPFAAAAAHLRGREETLCLTAHDGESAVLRRALAAENGIAPQIISLPRLLTAAAAGVPAADLPAAARLSSVRPAAARRELAMQIYTQLCVQSSSSSAAELLSRAAALADFFEEFMESRPDLCVSEDALPELCKTMSHDTTAFNAEVEAVSLLWGMLHERLHSARRALADFADIAPPLLYVGEEPRRPWTDDFLRRCANGAIVFAPENAAPAAADIAADSAAAWHPQVAHIVQCREAAASSPHRAAHLALAAVRDFAANGDTVGIVVYDRLLARRLRALAENHGIRIEDDGGWRMETLSFGGALRQWTETVCAFAPGQFSKILSAPFWQGHPQRAAAAGEWRRILAGEEALPLSLRDFTHFANTAFAPFANNLAKAQKSRPRPAAPLHQWTKWLLTHSVEALATWKDDAVAAKLRAELAAAAGEEPLTTTEFRAWLQMFMRGETGADGDVSSPACFVPPTTLRRFDSLVLLGAREGNLPPPPDSFWGENGRRALQLPGRDEYIAQQLAQFARLTTAHPKLAAIWQNGEDGRKTTPSPFWTLLTDAIKDAGKSVDTITPAADVPPNCNAPHPNPPPRAAGQMKVMPRTIGVTAAARLMNCPYHFFAKHILHLDEEDGDEMLQPAGRGMLLHRGMKLFAEKAGDETHPDKLLALWQETFSSLPAVRPGAKLAIQHWLLCGELFVKNEAARRAAGWLPCKFEHPVTATLALDGGEVLLRGRIDRVDYCAGEERWAITDYKSGGGPNKKAMRTGEEPQLPLYAFLFGKPAAQRRVCYPARDDDTVEAEEPAGNARRIAARLRAAARRIAAGADMVARHSDGDTCTKCPSRRLCRRDHWQTKDNVGESATH